MLCFIVRLERLPMPHVLNTCARTLLISRSDSILGFPLFEYHHFLMFFLVLAIIFYSEPPLVREKTEDMSSFVLGLVLSGCSTDAGPIRNIYLTSLSYQKIPASTSNSSALINSNLSATFAGLANGTSLEVRASYFGLCVLGGGGPQSWICRGDTSSIARLYQPQQDHLNIIWASTRFKTGIVFSGLMYHLLPLPIHIFCPLSLTLLHQ